MGPAPKRTRTAREATQGFTLLELLVVMAILGLIVSMVPLMMGRGLPGVELKSAARSVAAGLRQTRTEAIFSNQPIRFTIDLDDRRYTVSDADRWQELPGDFELTLETSRSEMLDETTGSIQFFPDGSASGGRISLSGKGREYHVMVDWLTGQVEIIE